MSTRPHPLDQVEIRFGIGGGVLVLAVIAARLAGLDEAYAALLLLGVCAVLGGTVGRGRAAVLGLTAWALVTGFVTHRYGVLTFAPSDLLLMLVLVVATVGSSSLVQHASRPARPRPSYRRAT
ncbi:hypothetical protein JCM18899A_24930 [Nocardioides sp. AN3]